ncbi:PET127 [Candida margitis]|uniref:PET127 n=1 Tax=Candida margitis TaxID=1775924 RepID=UPI002225F4EF|nr:PET127 [Candida margitis]KAI5970449.1 PET127 [Candida margitis]
MRLITYIWGKSVPLRSILILSRNISNQSGVNSKVSSKHNAKNDVMDNAFKKNIPNNDSKHPTNGTRVQNAEKVNTNSSRDHVTSYLPNVDKPPTDVQSKRLQKPGNEVATSGKTHNYNTNKIDRALSTMDRLRKVNPQARSSKRRSRSKKPSDTSDKLDCESGTTRLTSQNVVKKQLKQCIAPTKEDIPRLAHNLDRVLFSPGVHFLQDPRTRVYNFSPFLKNVIHYKDFNFDAAGSYTPVDKHKTLLENAKLFKKQFYSSTSSMTSILSKFYMLLNNYSPSKVERFGEIPLSGVATKLPSSTFVEPKGSFTSKSKKKTVYSLSADKSCDSEILLSAMGICMETLLTNPEDEFVKYRKDSTEEAPPSPLNAYNYASFGDFLMRSQLDCFDERLPGKGTFDLKTRASTNIRYNSHDPNVGETDYQIFKLTGQYESYEKEFRDLIKTGALLKYLFQARIGQMDGIFIAYHNINSIFGFQYLPLEELDKIFYSHADYTTVASDSSESSLKAIYEMDKLPSLVGETQFKFTMEIWETLLKEHIIKDFEASGLKDTAFRLVVQTYRPRYGRTQELRIYAIPVSVDEIQSFQSFADRYPTDFKQDLTQEQRDVNIKKHATELQKFNIDSLKGKRLLSYAITMGSSYIDAETTAYYNLPRHMPDSWRVQYCIKPVKNPSEKDFIKVFDLPIQQLNEQFQSANKSKFKFMKYIQQIHHRYEKIGTLRKKQWAGKEKTAKVYRPKYNL